LIELAAVLQDIATELTRLHARFAVVGGLAVSVRGTARFTSDADLAVAVTSDAEAEEIARELLGRGYRLHAQVDHRRTHRLAILRLVSPRSQGPSRFIVDLLFASSSLEPQVVEAAEQAVVLPGVVLPVARRGHLIAMKVLSASEKRPLDRADLLDLIALGNAEDMRLARSALESVQAQGLEGPRDLLAELDDYVRIVALPDPTLSPRVAPQEPPP
jgi:hypothetical protein